MNAGIGGVGSSATRWQIWSSRDHCIRNCAIACSRLTAYPRSDSDRLRSWATITQNQGASIGACGWRTIRPMTLSPSHVVIVITAAAALVGADKGEGGLDH